MYLTKLPSGRWRVIVQHAGRKLSGTKNHDATR